MNRKPFLKSLSEGRGNCPLPSRTHPQKQNLAVYTEELTHLGLALNLCLFCAFLCPTRNRKASGKSLI
jgi:hypothetical protein